MDGQRLHLDQLNQERAVLVVTDGPERVTVTITRTAWEKLGKPAELLLHLTTPTVTLTQAERAA